MSLHRPDAPPAHGSPSPFGISACPAWRSSCCFALPASFHPTLSPQFLELLSSHQSRPVKCLTIMWAMGQAGFANLPDGLRGKEDKAVRSGGAGGASVVPPGPQQRVSALSPQCGWAS